MKNLGHPGWLRWHIELSHNRTVMIPQHPGFGKSPQLKRIGNIRDLACFDARFIQEQGLTPIDVIGFSLGGWIARDWAGGSGMVTPRSGPLCNFCQKVCVFFFELLKT